MIYIKILNSSEEVASVEVLETPVYVFTNPKNGRILRCMKVLAHGVLDKTGSVIYQLQGKTPIDRAVATAVVITTAEYYELEATLGTEEDPEDTTPEIPEGTEGSDIMTRAQLTEKVNELDEAMALLLSGVTE